MSFILRPGARRMQRGASSLSYGLLIGLVAALSAVGSVGTNVNALFGRVGQVMEEGVPRHRPAATPTPRDPQSHSATVQPFAGLAFDVDAAALSSGSEAERFEATGMPAWASLNPSTGHITGTAPTAAVGTSTMATITIQTPGATDSLILTFAPQLARMCVDLANAGGTIDGPYPIDPDQDGTAMTAECVLSDGGWTQIVVDGSTPLSYLTSFPISADTVDDYQTDPAGISWGREPTSTDPGSDYGWRDREYRLVLDVPFGQVLVTHSGSFDTPTDGIARMDIETAPQASDILASVDGSGAGSGGQTLVVGGATVLSSVPTDIVDRTDTVTLSSPASSLLISFNGYDNNGYTGGAPWPYNRRHLRQLWVR